MPKAYGISTYEKVLDNKLAAYAALAGPALSAGGGRFLARGILKTYEGGLSERTVLIEFDRLMRLLRHMTAPVTRRHLRHEGGQFEVSALLRQQNNR